MTIVIEMLNKDYTKTQTLQIRLIREKPSGYCGTDRLLLYGRDTASSSKRVSMFCDQQIYQAGLR